MNGPKPSAPAARHRLMRLRGLVRKEWLQIRRDPSSIAIAFLLPVVLLLLFGYGVSLDARDVPVALVVDNPNPDTMTLCGHFERSKYLRPVYFADMRHAQQAMLRRQVSAILRLRDDFSRENLQRRGTIQLIVNGTDANTARIVTGYVRGVYARWLADVQQRRRAFPPPPVQVQQRVWYNANLRSRNYLVPGLVAIIMTLIGALLTAMVMAREWERGTIEALMTTPVSMGEVLLGKVIPYFVLGLGGMALSVAMARWVFDVPFRGSVSALVAGSVLFLLVALGLGLLISTTARNQFVAGQVAIIVTFLPAFILSGFIFDIRSMPWPIRALTAIIPARHFVTILQNVFLAGDVWPLLLPSMGVLALMALVFLGLSYRKSPKRLD